MEQKGSHSCRADQVNVANPEQLFLQDSTPTSSLPPTADGGLLTFDQSKCQLLWAPEDYQGYLDRRRLNGGSLTSSKSYDVK
ncbi:8672_t:CDS:2, partial [Dentiscutata erythropus]